MSVPPFYAYPAPVTPHGRAGPRSNGPRVHAIVAFCVIATVGLLGAVLSVIAGALASDGCVSPDTPKFQCTGFGEFFFVWCSPIAVALACGLAIVGIVGRARGGHVWSTLAWCVWGGFCLVWWAVAVTL